MHKAFYYWCLHVFLEKLLLSSRQPKDYGFTLKGCETADGIDDHEEFKATEVTKRLHLFLIEFERFTTQTSSSSGRQILTLVSQDLQSRNMGENLLSLLYCVKGNDCVKGNNCHFIETFHNLRIGFDIRSTHLASLGVKSSRWNCICSFR